MLASMTSCVSFLPKTFLKASLKAPISSMPDTFINAPSMGVLGMGRFKVSIEIFKQSTKNTLRVFNSGFFFKQFFFTEIAGDDIGRVFFFISEDVFNENQTGINHQHIIRLHEAFMV